MFNQTFVSINAVKCLRFSDPDILSLIIRNGFCTMNPFARSVMCMEMNEVEEIKAGEINSPL